LTYVEHESVKLTPRWPRMAKANPGGGGGLRLIRGWRDGLLLPLLALAAATWSCGRAPDAAALPKYRIGFMICNSEQETLDRFRPLAAWLGREVGADFEPVAIDTVDFLKRVDGLDFTHTNSLLYVNMHRLNGVEVVAAEKAGPDGFRARGTILALRKSGIGTVADLKGRTFAFGPPLGPLSYMTQVDLLQRAGLDPDRDLASYSIPAGSFKHEKVVYGILFGRWDAGAVPLGDFHRMAKEGRIDADDFTVVAEGEPIPYCTFGRTQRVDDRPAAAVRDALARLDAGATVELDGEVVRVLARAGIDGYEVVREDEFDAVREMAKRTNMPPYQRY
jgi:phosphonate transport system substrate-binding protein